MAVTQNNRHVYHWVNGIQVKGLSWGEVLSDVLEHHHCIECAKKLESIDDINNQKCQSCFSKTETTTQA